MEEFSEPVMYILKNRYLRDGETPKEMFRRVADFVGQTDEEKEDFFDVMTSLKFLPNTPCLMNANSTFNLLSPCFVLPISDSMSEIMGTLTNTVMIQKYGGGVGINFSPLRPKGAPINSTGGVSSGSVSFMEMFNTAVNVVEQGGARRGAMIGILDYNHPDVYDFIKSKEIEGTFTNFNISVGMREEVFKKNTFNIGNEPVSSEDFLRTIAHYAWKTGDPGLAFLDNVNKDNPLDTEITASNPCNEQYLLPYECCNLGSINLMKVLNSSDFNWSELEGLIYKGIRFLDNVIDVQDYPLPQNGEIQKKYRRVGLGLMGWADVLEYFDIEYDSKEALKLAEKLMKFFNEKSIKMSEELGKEKGYIEGFKRRNITVNSVQPTGTMSMISGCSSSIEPHFAKDYSKVVMDGKSINEYKSKGKTAHDIRPEDHIRMQAAFQKYTDGSISKTINAKRNATVQDVYDAFILAHKLGCKGITVFRDGCKQTQVLRKPTGRPDVLTGNTFKTQTGCGSMYITPNELNGDLFEMFINAGYTDACIQCLLESIARVISKSIRSGVDPRRLADAMVKRECSRGKSCSQAIAEVLNKATKSEERECRNGRCEL